VMQSTALNIAARTVSKKKPVATSSVIASGFHLTLRTGQRLLPPA
jgi:hypothetical protein